MLLMEHDVSRQFKYANASVVNAKKEKSCSYIADKVKMKVVWFGDFLENFPTT